MNQVSYGTITITDTNDIEQIYMVYAGSESNVTPPDVSDFALWKTDVTQTSGTYIWQRTVVKKSGIEITAVNFQQFYGEPVCVTGDGGRSIKSITTYYCNYGTGTPEENYSGWSIDTPEYDEDKPNYWIKTVIIYVDDSEEEFELNGDIVTFEDGEHKHLTSLTATIDPKQDLHGYDKPWVGGAGKNKLNLTSITPLKDENGITFTVNADGTIKANGTATARSQIYWNIPKAIAQTFGGMILNGCVSQTGAKLILEDAGAPYTSYAEDTGSGATISASIASMPTDNAHLIFRVTNGTTLSNVTIKPMIRLASDTDATFEPYSNICPISGWDSVNANVSSVNVWDEEWEVGGYNTTTGEKVVWANGIRNKNRIPIVPNTGYYFNVPYSVGSSGLYIYYYDADGNYISNVRKWSKSFTTIENARYINFELAATYGTTYNNDISINYPATDTDYHTYIGTAYTTDLPETVYGGSLDVVSGVLTIDKAMVNLGTLNWGYNSSYEFFYGKINSLKENGNLLCSAYNFVGPKSNEAMANVVNGSIATSITKYAKIKNTAYTNTTSFKTAINGVQLVYELAEPRTIQLTPKQVTILLGTNNVWADSGDVGVSGFTIVNKDIQIHIDNSLTEALSKAANALEKANEAESIAAHANEDSQGALSIATGINQHFFSIPNDYSESVPAGSYITEINVDEFKRSPSGGNLLTRSDGVWLRNGADILASLQGTGLNFLIPTGTYKGRKSLEILGGTAPALKLYDAQNNNAVATLNSNGLVLSKGGIRVNTVGSNNGVYISSENLGSKVTSLDADKINWRAVIGSKFGVDSEGNLYANEAHVSGAITATSLQVDGLGDFMSFMTFENDVLKITKPGFNYTVEIRNDGVYIVDPNNNTIASYRNYITLGTKDGNNIDIRSDSINFNIGDKTFAYVAQDKWLTSNAEVSGAMYIGNYSLRQNSNGNFILGRRY